MPRYATSSGCSSPGRRSTPTPSTARPSATRPRYSYRWVNNQGDVIYTDENSFDPNAIEEYKTREWKRTPIRKR